jgi:lysophospholipase L1-like esterase
MKLLILLTCLLASFQHVLADLSSLHAELQKTWPKNRTVNIVFHGHSVPAGYYKAPRVNPYGSYPHLFEKRLKQSYPNAVINAIVTAIGGENSASGAKRFNEDVLRFKPDLIFIDYGLNDRGISLEATAAAWKSMISAAQEAGIPVVLITPTGDTRANFSNPEDPLTQRAVLIRRLAKETNTLLADVSAAWLAELKKGTPQADLHSTGNHPSLKGHQLATSVLFDCFTQAVNPPAGP